MIRAALLALIVALFGAEARAADWIIEKDELHKDSTLDVIGVLSPWVVGGGATYSIPAVQDGLLPNVNDSFDLEGSLYLVYDYWGHNSYVALWPVAGVR